MGGWRSRPLAQERRCTWIGNLDRKDTPTPRQTDPRNRRGHCGPETLSSLLTEGLTNQTATSPSGGGKRGEVESTLSYEPGQELKKRMRGGDAASSPSQTVQVPRGVLGATLVLTLKSRVKRKPRLLAGLH